MDQNHPPGHHQHHGHQPASGDERHDHMTGHGSGLNKMAASATLHCLTGCAIGEILGLIIGTAAGLGNGWTTAIAIALAFLFGYTLSTLPLIKAGLTLGVALGVVVAADTLSIATMEVVDNTVMLVIPGAMNAGLVNVMFWISMALALTVAFAAAYPVNRYLLQRGKGHALTHRYHRGASSALGLRRRIPDLSPGLLAAILASFMLGGLVVATADELSQPAGPPASQIQEPHTR